VGGRLDANVGAWLGSTAPTVGQKVMADSLPVVIASDQSSLPVAVSPAADVTASGTITAIDPAGIIGYNSVSSSVPAADTSVSVAITGHSTVEATITGTWTGNLIFESTSDGTNWQTTHARSTGSHTGSYLGYGYNAAFPTMYRANVAGFSEFRVRAVTGQTTSVTSVTVHLRATVAPAPATDPITVVGPAGNGGGVKNAPVLVAGYDGAKVQIPRVDPNGVQVSQSYGEAISNGLIAGGAIASRIMGQVTTAATTEAAIRATAYTEQTSNAQRSINSTSASDTAAGVGARSVRLTYYSFAAGVITGPFTEDVTLNGVTAVNTVSTTICFIEKIEVITAGSGTASNVGVIQLFAATAGGGGVIASIAAAERTTRYAHHYVASGNVCNIVNVQASSTATSGNTPVLRVRFRDPSATTNAERELIAGKEIQGSQSTIQLGFDPPRAVTGPAVILYYATPTNAGSQIFRVESCFYEQ
jgi:hypothetical protein